MKKLKAPTTKVPKVVNALASPPKPRLRTKAPKLTVAPKLEMASPPSFKCGGEVKKTGMALVHKGEKVLTKKQQGRK